MRLSALLLIVSVLCCSLPGCAVFHRSHKGEGLAPSASEEQATAIKEKEEPGRPAGPAVSSIAIFPFENLSGSPVPLKSLKASFSEELTHRGFQVLGEEALDKFIVSHRIRYTAGVDKETAQALKKETGVMGVLLTSIELFSEGPVPKIALTSRLVSTGDAPAILWVDGVGMTGDDHPGLLGLGLIKDPGLLIHKAFSKVGESLAAQVFAGAESKSERTQRKFRPRIAYKSDLGGDQKYTVAIAPFFNKSLRKHAGDMLALQFVRALGGFNSFQVIEPGLVRDAFLNARIIMDEGVSLTDAQILFAVLGADLVLAGEVLDYQDYQGFEGSTRVSFTVQLIEKKSRMVVWSSESFNRGDEGVYFFDLGKVNTAHTMAVQMAESIGEMLVKR